MCLVVAASAGHPCTQDPAVGSPELDNGKCCIELPVQKYEVLVNPGCPKLQPSYISRVAIFSSFIQIQNGGVGLTGLITVSGYRNCLLDNFNESCCMQVHKFGCLLQN